MRKQYNMNISEPPRQFINYKTHVIFAKQSSSSADSVDLDSFDDQQNNGDYQANSPFTYLQSLIPDVIKNYYVPDDLNEVSKEWPSFSIINCKLSHKVNGNSKRDSR